MNNAISKGENTPDNYSPSTPEILNIAEDMITERVLQTIQIEDVSFDIVEKTRTLYAGFHAYAKDNYSEPEGTWEAFQAGMSRIKDSMTPDCMICMSIGYANWDNTYKLEMMHGQETSNPDQPADIYVIDAPPTLFIRTKATDATWALTKKLTGEDNPVWHMAPLFSLIKRIFMTDEYGYQLNNNGNNEMEYYYPDRAYVYVPVRKL